MHCRYFPTASEFSDFAYKNACTASVGTEQIEKNSELKEFSQSLLMKGKTEVFL